MAPTESTPPDISISESTPVTGFAKWNQKIESLAGLESRGISRVLPHERSPPSNFHYIQMASIWFSANLTANNLALGLLGPLVYELSFTDSALCAVFGAVIGSAATAYMGIWGAESGNRTLIVARYFMGYHPSKICCLLNIVIMVGYGMIDCIISGQILSAISGTGMSIAVGIIIVAIITWLVALFGIGIFHHYERWAWIPQAVALLILVGSAGPKFDTTAKSVGNTETINADRLTFLSLCLSAPVSWGATSSDFYVYFPETTSKPFTFVMTLLGLALSNCFVYLLGVGLGSGITTNPSWSDAYDVSSGALILAGYDGLGGFGKFLGVIIAAGLIANNIPGTYAAALNIQMCGRYAAVVPRWVLTTVVAVIYTVCALAGQDHLFEIFENFLALMGYWVCIFISIVLEEHLIFRRGKTGLGFDWAAWNDKSRLPLGIAALISFCVGWVGAVICMDQVYFVGPVAKQIGEYGADLGIWVGSAFAAIVYPGLRWLELKKFGR
ncbi:putative vitamin B6 transporter [Tricladium varicosporioides]|nr:putative vitamin B6 transporter [Hymenoscyphus varicosporioides]